MSLKLLNPKALLPLYSSGSCILEIFFSSAEVAHTRNASSETEADGQPGLHSEAISQAYISGFWSGYSIAVHSGDEGCRFCLVPDH